MDKRCCNMTARQKLDIIIYLVTIAITILLTCVGFIFGPKCLIVILLSVLLLVCLFLAVVLLGPCAAARRAYKSRPPRQVYDEISSKPGYCRLSALPFTFIEAIRCCEDPYFYSHKGLNVDSIVNAIAHNLFLSGKPIGASTIPMQLIKNIWLDSEVTYRRKITQIIMTGRLEKELSKSQILELYVNVIYYGCDKWGITDAAEHYYGVEPSKMTFDQSLSLAAILPCPDKYNKKANPVYFNQVKKKALQRLLLYSSAIRLSHIKLDN